MILSKRREVMRVELQRLRSACGFGAPGGDLDEARAEAYADGYAQALEELAGDGDVRPEVERFALAMEAKLKIECYDRGWRQRTNDDLLERLREELEALENALHPASKYRPGKVRRKAAAVANYAMMLADNAGELKDEA